MANAFRCAAAVSMYAPYQDGWVLPTDVVDRMDAAFLAYTVGGLSDAGVGGVMFAIETDELAASGCFLD